MGGFIVDDDAADDEEVPVPARRRGAYALEALVQTQKVCWMQPLTHAAAAAAAAKARRRKREPLEADPHGPKINEGEEGVRSRVACCQQGAPSPVAAHVTRRRICLVTFESHSRPRGASQPAMSHEVITCSSRNLF